MGKRSISQVFQVNWLEGAQWRESPGQRKQCILDTWLISGNEGDSGWLEHRKSWEVVEDMKQKRTAKFWAPTILFKEFEFQEL